MSGLERDAWQAELAQIARALADPARPLDSLIGETGKLRAFVERHSQLSMEASDSMNEGESTLASGWAISPVQAALCAREPLRSAAFVQGLAAAIHAASTPQRPVSVLYAGCGPFALLALPLMAIFSPQQLRFTILEVHQEALDYARALIDKLGYGAHVAAFACADAFSTITATSIQMHGGIAFTWAHPAHLYLRRARADAHLFGSSDFYRERYVQQLGG